MKLTATFLLVLLTVACSGAPFAPSALSPSGLISPTSDVRGLAVTYNDIDDPRYSCPSAAPNFEFQARDGALHLYWQVNKAPAIIDVEYLIERWNGSTNAWEVKTLPRNRASVGERNLTIPLGAIGDFDGRFRATLRYRYRDGLCGGGVSNAASRTLIIDAPEAELK